MRVRAIALLVLLCTGVALCQAVVRGGVGLGPYRLGSSFSAVKASLGNPSKIIASQVVSESQTSLCVYRRQGLAFNVKADKIIGITIFSSSYSTPDGLHVGSSRRQVEQQFGPPQTLRAQDVTYPERGLAFRYDDQNRIEEVYVVDKEGRDALKGDRSIRAGQRIGGITLGMDLRGLMETWGRPDKTGPLPSSPGNVLMLFQDKGILVIAGPGKVEGVTTVSPEYGTPEGLRVGASSRADVYRVYGPHPDLVNGIDTYKRAGIGFTIEKDKVTEITVLPPSR